MFSSLLFTLSSPSGARGQNRAVSRQILVPYDHDLRRPQMPFSAALRDLRGQRCCRCRSSWPFVTFVDKRGVASRSFVALRGQKEAAVAVAVLRGPPCPPRTKVLPLPFFVALSILRAVAVLAVALRGPPCPPRTKVLPLPFFVSGPSWINRGVLRGPSRPFVDKKKLQLQFCSCVAVAVLRGP